MLIDTIRNLCLWDTDDQLYEMVWMKGGLETDTDKKLINLYRIRNWPPVDDHNDTILEQIEQDVYKFEHDVYK